MQQVNTDPKFICPSCGSYMKLLFTSFYCDYKHCLASKGATVRTRRENRVVGRVPDFWQGAPAAWRWAEGRSVVMVLEPDLVPVTKELVRWHHVPYASAHDCNFDKFIAQVPSIVRSVKDWELKLPVPNKEEAKYMLESNRVLLYVPRG